MARDDRPWSGGAPPGVAFTYALGRGGHHAERILQGFTGIDGYAGSEGFDGALFTAAILTRDRDFGGDRTRTRHRQQTRQIPSDKAVNRRARRGVTALRQPS